MRFSPTAFNRLLDNVAQEVSWRRSYACPCVNPRSGAADTACVFCDGRGRQWGDGVLTSAAVASRDTMRQFAPMGVLDGGDIMLSIPESSALYEIGEFDRIEMVNRTEPFSINLVRGLNDRVRFPVVNIERVAWKSGALLVEGVAPTEIVAGIPTWASGAPPSGVTYSVTGRRHPEYFCYLGLAVDRPLHAGARMPRRVLMRRFDLFGR